MFRISFWGPLALFAFIFACTKEVKTSPSFIFSPAPAPGQAAKFKNKIFSNAELEKGVQTEIYKLEQQMYELKMARVKSWILEELMASDSRKKNLSNDEFLNKYILNKAVASDKEVDDFIKDRGFPKQHVNDQLKDRVKQFLSQDLKKKALDEWIQANLAKAPAEVYLSKPKSPVFDIPDQNSFFFGKADAKVTVTEFSDFQCPYCARAATGLVKELKEKYGNKIRFVFKNFPLPGHQNAEGAARASLCAGTLAKKFWGMHDLMFSKQNDLGREALISKATSLGIDAKKFESCLDSKEIANRVEAEKKAGVMAEVNSTPSFFVNGEVVPPGSDFEKISELIDLKMGH